LIKEQLEETIIRILILATFVSLLVGIWKEGLAEVKNISILTETNRGGLKEYQFL